MDKPLVFMMGRSPAILPVDRCYARNHMWAVAAKGRYRVGFSAYAVKLLGDVRCLEWSVDGGVAVESGQQVGYIEASKATSDLYAPMTGRIAEINPRLTAEPVLINTNLYDDGWLMTIEGNESGLLSPQEYLAHVEAVWPLAQRLLKGQVNRRRR